MKKARMDFYIIILIVIINLCCCTAGETEEGFIGKTEENEVLATEENEVHETDENAINKTEENTGIVEEGDSVMTDLNQKSFTEIRGILEKYGISGITDEMIEWYEENMKLMPEVFEFNNKTAMLLTEAGTGVTNYDTWEWTPAENGVYCFDVEVFNSEMMYTNFLLGVSAIGEGELDFNNITEDTSGVDWENGTGKRTVSFEWNGCTYTLEAECNHDWFDIAAASGLSRIIRENGNGKRLYFASDGYQECIIFYRDAEWAEAFQKETGLELSEY